MTFDLGIRKDKWNSKKYEMYFCILYVFFFFFLENIRDREILSLVSRIGM